MRTEALSMILRVLAEVPADQFGAEALFHDGDRSRPCCAIGHALYRIPGALERYDEAMPGSRGYEPAAIALGISDEDFDDITIANDCARKPIRKYTVLNVVKVRLEYGDE